jgi:hypothetical protein
MSGKPGQFKDFNKTAQDLLTKVFPKKTGANSWGLELELKPTKYQTFGSKLTNVGGVSTGEVSTEVNLSDFGVTSRFVFRTDKPTLEASWKVSDKIPVDGLSAKVHFDASSNSQTAGVSVAYEHQYLTANARVAVPVTVQILDFARDLNNQDTNVDLDLVLAHPDYKFVLGGSTKVSFPVTGERRLDESVVSLGYRDGKLFAPSISYTQKSGDKEDSRAVSAVFVSQPADTQYVAQLDYQLGSKKTVATLGFAYPLNDGAILKAKFNSQKEIGIGYSKQISASTKLDFGSLFQISSDKSTSIDSAFSLNLRFTQ